MAPPGHEAGAPAGCGSHTATAVPDEARGNLYIYNGGSSGTCNGIDIFRIKIADSDRRRRSCARVTHGRARPTPATTTTCCSTSAARPQLAMCAGGNGLAMFKFDLTAGRRGRAGREPDPAVVEVDAGVTTGHSGSFTYDGKHLIYGHEPGGGSAARCQATSTIVEQDAVLHRSADRRDQGDDAAPAPADQPRELHMAQLQRHPDQGRLLRDRRQLPVGHLGVRVHRTRRRRARSPTPTRRRWETPSRPRRGSSSAATGRRTGTTAPSTSPTSSAVSPRGA